jgi:L-asparaginase II
MPEFLIVETTRGAAVESTHRVSVAVVGTDGKLKLGLGNPQRLTFPRSAMKPIQALASIECGAFDAAGLGQEQIALHCASHSGETGHVERVEGWLEALGLDESALECGPQTPLWAMYNMQRAHEAPPPRPLANNCSGKHAGFLTAARQLGAPLEGYVALEHPVQRRIRALVARLTGIDEAAFVTSTDLCRAPVWAMPLDAFARAMAQLAVPSGLQEGQAEAATRVCAAMRAHPWLVAGTGREDTLLMQEPEFQGIAKCGAEGCYAMAIPEAGLGIAIKVEDGAARAAPVAAVEVLRSLGLLSVKAVERLQVIARPQIRNWSREVIGEIRPAACP